MTFIGFPDIVVTSPNGKLRLEIRGSKAKDDFFRDQSDFVYRLVRAEDSQLVWEWTPPENSGLADYPHEAWVNDQGWAVVRCHTWFGAGILVLSPTGELKLEQAVVGLGEERPLIPEDAEGHAGHSSAGPFWSASSIAVFQEWEGRPFWSILAWWGRRFVFDLDRGIVLDQVSEELERGIAAAEEDWIFHWFQHVPSRSIEDDQAHGVWWQQFGRHVYSAAYHAGVKKLTRAEPFLRSLEKCVVTGGQIFGNICVRLYSFRRLAKASLLRMGFIPDWYASFILIDRKTEAPLKCPERSDRSRLQEIAAGMTLTTLLQRVGIPDFLEWDYIELNGNSIGTLRVHWKCEEKLVTRLSIKVDGPPIWVDRIERFDLPPWVIDGDEYSLAHG